MLSTVEMYQLMDLRSQFGSLAISSVLETQKAKRLLENYGDRAILARSFLRKL